MSPNTFVQFGFSLDMVKDDWTSPRYYRLETALILYIQI